MTFSRVLLEAHASKVEEALKGYCRRIERTGALRRGDANGSSIDFICIADDPGAVARRCLRHTYRVHLDHLQLSAAMKNGLVLRIYFARPPKEDIFEPEPSNIEVLQVIHTPTRPYLHDFVKYIRSKDYFLSRDKGLVARDNRTVANTEATIYDCLDLALPHPSRMLEFRPKFIYTAF